MYLQKLKTFQRRSLVQAIILGLVSFTEPGIFNSLQTVGAGGLQTVTTANAANIIVFALMTAVSPLAAVLINKIGIKWSILLGCIGFPLYSAGLYKNSLDGTQWLVIFGSVFTGLSAQFFWIGEGTAAVYFPSEERSMFVGLWQFVNKFGYLVAGSITLSLNINQSSKGAVSLKTFIGFITINCVGAFISLLIVKPEEVIRRDGSIAKTNITNESLTERFAKIIKVYRKKEVLLLAPICLASMWFQTWQSNYITTYFSVRSRSLNTLLTAFVQMSADLGTGFLLDLKKFDNRTKLRWSWHIINILLTGFFVYSFIMQGIYNNNPVSGLDWTDNDWARGFIPFVLFRAFKEILTNWIYWVVGTMNFHRTEVTYVVSVVRGYETFGEMLAFIVATVNDNNMVSLAVSAAVYFFAAFFVTYLIHFVIDNASKENEIRNKGLEEEMISEDDSVIIQIDTRIEDRKKLEFKN